MRSNSSISGERNALVHRRKKSPSSYVAKDDNLKENSIMMKGYNYGIAIKFKHSKKNKDFARILLYIFTMPKQLHGFKHWLLGFTISISYEIS